jgi:hypothetical protein
MTIVLLMMIQQTKKQTKAEKMLAVHTSTEQQEGLGEKGQNEIRYC